MADSTASGAGVAFRAWLIADPHPVNRPHFLGALGAKRAARFHIPRLVVAAFSSGQVLSLLGELS